MSDRISAAQLAAGRIDAQNRDEFVQLRELQPSANAVIDVHLVTEAEQALALIHRLRCEIAEARGEAEAATRAASEAIAHVREHYSENIFPPRPPGQHSEVYDGEAASVARLTCDNILREFEERLAEARGSSVWTQESAP